MKWMISDEQKCSNCRKKNVSEYSNLEKQITICTECGLIEEKERDFQEYILWSKRIDKSIIGKNPDDVVESLYL